MWHSGHREPGNIPRLLTTHGHSPKDTPSPYENSRSQTFTLVSQTNSDTKALLGTNQTRTQHQQESKEGLVVHCSCLSALSFKGLDASHHSKIPKHCWEPNPQTDGIQCARIVADPGQSPTQVGGTVGKSPQDGSTVLA